MGRKGFRGALAVAALAMTMPAVAEAGTAFVVGPPGDRFIGYLQEAGESGTVEVTETLLPAPAVRFTERDDTPVAAAPGCTVILIAPAASTVECPTEAGDRVGVGLDDGDDQLAGELADLPMVVDLGAGNDLVLLGRFDGPTEVVGGPGTDAAHYTASPQSVSVTLDAVADDGREGEGDLIRPDIETLLGSNAADELLGGDGPQTLQGGGGADLLDGGAGNDVLHAEGGCEDVLLGGPGDDLLRPQIGPCGGQEVHGGDGRDLLDLTSVGEGAVVLATLDGVADDGRVEVEVGDNFHADIEDVAGGPGTDIIVGTGAANVLDGGPGDDLVDGGPGADDLRGGPGEDVADYRDRTASVRLTLDGSGNDGEAGEEDVLRDDLEHLVGGSGNDELVGGPGDNGLDGGPGGDVIRGGGGTDAVDYALRAAAVTVDLDGAPADDGQPGEGDTVAADVEGVIGGEGADALTGNGLDGFLSGGPGADVLMDAGGADNLDGGPGADIISARDRVRDLISCGSEADRVVADLNDRTDADCETVTRAILRDPPVPQPQPQPQPPAPVVVPRPPVADTRAPRAAIFARTGNGLAKTLRRSALTVRVGCDEPCSATAKLTAHAATARSLARRGYKRGTLVARGTSKRGTLEKLALKQTARGKKMLRALRRGTYRLTVVVTDAAGNRTTVRRTVIVRR